MAFTLNGYYTLILATLVLLLGRVLVKRIKFLSDFNIPEPVAGGLVAAIIVYVLNLTLGYSFDFQKQLQTACMLMFFASIGLSADFGRLQAGGKPLLVFLAVVSSYIFLQDLVGVVMAKLVDLPPLMGLMTGSIALTGGHGTAGAWGTVFESKHGLAGATTLGIACAIYGLVAGGLIGGPVAKRLMKRLNREPIAEPVGQNSVEKVASNQSLYSTKHDLSDDTTKKEVCERPDNIRLITASSTIETLALFAGALAFADIMTHVSKGTWFELPTFVGVSTEFGPYRAVRTFV